MSFLPPDYKTPETSPSYDYKPKVLELIARTLGDAFPGHEMVPILKSAGVPDTEIDYPNTKWKTILNALNYAMNERNAAQINVEGIIKEFLDPLNSNADEEGTKILAERIEKLLKYDNLLLKRIGMKYAVFSPTDYQAYLDQIQEDAFNGDEWREQQTMIEGDLAQKIEEEQEKQKVLLARKKDEKKKYDEDLKILTKNRERIFEIKELHQAYIDLMEIYCNETSHPTDDLNSHYIFLKKHLQKLINELHLNESTIVYIPFKGDLYSAEKEWGQDTLKGSISWDKIRPELFSVHSWITRRCSAVENHEQQNDNKKKLDDINKTIEKYRIQKPEIQQEAQKTMKIEILKMPDLNIKNVDNETITKNKKKISLPKFSETPWNKAGIRFINEQTVILTAGSKTATADFEGLGFRNDKNSRPNSAWHFLFGLAKSGGETQTISSPIPDSMKQQKKALSDRLKNIFKNETDPFEDFSQSNTYKIKIKLIPPVEETKLDDLGVKEYLKDAMTSEYQDEYEPE